MLDGNNLGSTGQLQWLESGLFVSTGVLESYFYFGRNELHYEIPRRVE